MILLYMQFNTSRGVSIPRCQTKYAVPQSTQNITICDHVPKLKQEICHPSTITEIPHSENLAQTRDPRRTHHTSAITAIRPHRTRIAHGSSPPRAEETQQIPRSSSGGHEDRNREIQAAPHPGRRARTCRTLLQ